MVVAVLGPGVGRGRGRRLELAQGWQRLGDITLVMFQDERGQQMKSTDARDDRIQVELDRVSRRLRQEVGAAGLYCQLYAAQQALSWALDPELAAAPFDAIVSGKVQSLTGTQASSEDCSVALRPPVSSDTCAPPRYWR